MRAIILAAGKGSRLIDAGIDHPKCLLQFAGVSLLARHIEILESLGISRLHLVLGFEADAIVEHLKQLRPSLPITVHHNHDFSQGSVVSLCRAHDALVSGEEVLVMDADVLYSPQILERLVQSEHANCLLLDTAFEPGDEPVKICLQNERLVEFRKHLSPLLHYDIIGESVGFFRFDAEVAAALATQCAYYIDGGQPYAPHEEAVRDLLLTAGERFAVEDVTGQPWIEIDFPEDITRAEMLILPAVDAERARRNRD